jgi:hypothetical protein
VHEAISVVVVVVVVLSPVVLVADADVVLVDKDVVVVPQRGSRLLSPQSSKREDHDYVAVDQDHVSVSDYDHGWRDHD